MHFNLEFWIIVAHIVHWCRELVEETGEIKRILKSWADGWRWHENLVKYKRLQGKYVLPRPSVRPLAEAKKLKYLEFLSQLSKPFQTFSHMNPFLPPLTNPIPYHLYTIDYVSSLILFLTFSYFFSYLGTSKVLSLGGVKRELYLHSWHVVCIVM
jgi:hypothetical protein